ncbi:hypothetical protein FOA52_014310 [Chlamydomonas sp. UWO 241]|nr:hypothetical protein FOA52_014310 [Chlamydomonas sp. UWO 241]
MGRKYDVDISVDAREPKDSKGRGMKREKPAVKQREESESDSDDSSDGEANENLGFQPLCGPLSSPSASYRQFDVVCGSHQYTISGFSMARSMGCGTRLCSDFFEVCGQLFRLEVYPGGFTADTRKFVSVFLTTPGTTNPNHVLYEVAVLDQSGRDRHIIEARSMHDRGGGSFGRGPCGPFDSGPMCAYGPMLSYNRGIVAALPKFIKASFLEKNTKRYLPCDMAVFRITVQVLQGWSSQPMVHYHASYNAGRVPGPVPGVAPGMGHMGGPQGGMLMHPGMGGEMGGMGGMSGMGGMFGQPQQLPGFTAYPGGGPVGYGAGQGGGVMIAGGGAYHPMMGAMGAMAPQHGGLGAVSPSMPGALGSSSSHGTVGSHPAPHTASASPTRLPHGGAYGMAPPTAMGGGSPAPAPHPPLFASPAYYGASPYSATPFGAPQYHQHASPGSPSAQYLMNMTSPHT